MTVVGIPNVVVVEAIGIDLELAIVDVHVSNEELCSKPSISPLPKSWIIESYSGHRSPLVCYTN
jgi:hypothetical protein